MTMLEATLTPMMQKPKVTVIRGFGNCPAGYRVGETFRVRPPNPSAAFKCTGAFEAIEPYIDAIEERADRDGYPTCQFVASCDCPLSDGEMVFYLHPQPARV